MKPFASIFAAAVVFGAQAQNVVLSNDDGWAVAAVRAFDNALKGNGYQVVLSCPAVDKSGTGSSTATPTTLSTPCEFNTCPVGSPATGHNASDPFLNYVNAFPADAARFGIQNFAPQLLGGVPDILVAGPNVGNNLGNTVQISGTVGAACEAALLGVPSIAFSGSGSSLSLVSYTTLDTSPTSTASRAALIYASLSTTFVNALIKDVDTNSTPILPRGIVLNVNYPSINNGCDDPQAYSFVLSRILQNDGATDVSTCGSDHLPTETSVVNTSGCFASVSVFNASTKADVDADTQALCWIG
ncbi:hypothetical protein D9758_006246 [Tetrapyrgos nigripes]|uniref:Survival protein SurE-like phosphatase/nucleotidase domain-containing protein n=1 Tax=Tetrapyrgos nigripes TaxID=182062 RepID=A0A8H5GAJ2_9AGAR|nr:hypothetical protein D9758_006246 [Tetrapyrgos nigripes]